MKTALRKILSAIKIDEISLLFTKGSYLNTTGWFKSAYTKKAVDKDGNPIPWLTYPIVKFLDERLNNTLTMYEFGSGYSTVWFSKRVKNIFTVEHEENWYKHLVSIFPGNVTSNIVKLPMEHIAKDYHQLGYFKREETTDYAKSIKQTTTKFDVVLIDGIDRLNCGFECLDNLTDKGVVILDNSNFEENIPLFEHYKNAGFKRLDFWGMSPVIPNESCTSIFYKSNNCFNI